MKKPAEIKRTSCIFGAGASAAYGIPTLNQLPQEINKYINECKSVHFKETFSLVKKIVFELQGKDIEKEWIDYEHLLGQLDYFIRNNSIIRVDNYLLDKEVLSRVDIPGGLTKPFRALWSTGLCRQLGKSKLIINILIRSKCYGINFLLFRNGVVNGSGIYTYSDVFTMNYYKIYVRVNEVY